jgi:hypothetical protein
MVSIWLALVSVVKNIFLKVVSEAFFEWLFFWAARMLVDSTKTTKDDEFYFKVKELYEQGK